MLNIVTIGYRYDGLDDLFLDIDITVRNVKHMLDNYDMFIDWVLDNHVLYYMESNLEYPFTEENIILPLHKREFMKLIDKDVNAYILKNQMLGNIPSSIMQKKDYINFLRENKLSILKHVKQLFLTKSFGYNCLVQNDGSVIVADKGKKYLIGNLKNLEDFYGLVSMLSKYQKRKYKEQYKEVGSVINYYRSFYFI